jgi:uncharacterized membrane protein (UPF0127 family)
MMRIERRLLSGTAAALLGLATVLTACSSQARSGEATQAVAGQPTPATAGQPAQATAGQPAMHLISGLPVIDLTVTHGHQRHHFRVEVARTAAEQEKGLMFRTAMAPDEGMIFPMPQDQPSSFWMKNTVIPLDIIFIGVDGRISNIAANAVPYDETPLPSKGPVSGVLELNGGRAAQLGIGPGDAVKW